MEHINRMVGPALSTLQARTERPPVNTEAVRSYFDRFVLVGNETEDEVRTLVEMRDAAEQWCGHFLAGDEPRWLSFVGHSGAGKTWLAEAIRVFLKHHAARTYAAHYRRRTDPEGRNYLSGYLYQQEGRFLVKWPALIEKARNSDYWPLRCAADDFVKIIDDVGAETLDKSGNPTPFAIGALSNLCDSRVRKWTVLTSNYDRAELAQRYDARIASRMMRDESVIVTCDVRDFNLRREQMPAT
jgi:energy-coupling factor transporter ATP-binding protein EcfA2